MSDALLGAAVDVAYYLRVYGSYRGSIKGALRALRGRQPGFRQEEYDAALTRALALVDDAVRLATAHVREVQQTRKAQPTYRESWKDTLIREHPGFPTDVYDTLIAAVHHWYIER